MIPVVAGRRGKALGVTPYYSRLAGVVKHPVVPREEAVSPVHGLGMHGNGGVRG
ncbi:hypothetical protein E2C01_090972 [Portunus trituberculatus]|uniref:Uncharacterized protein n=1 Tax=Portunus trituberculatus TaxID=210409 RepID=A0A5B7JRJ8_PORTR|nr:hypothetical protein [Portunus trituberculatus]